MGCKLSISVVAPSKSPLCKKRKTIDIPTSPIVSEGTSSDKCSNSVDDTDTSDDDSDGPPDAEEGNIFSGKFKGRLIP